MGANIFIIFLLSPLLQLATFSIFFATGHNMSLAQGFACLQVLASLNMPIRWIPGFIGTLLQFTVSMRRIQKFLTCDEIHPEIVEYDSAECKRKGLDILVQGASFSWGGLRDEEAKKPKGKDSKSKEENKDEKSDSKKFNTGINEDKTNEEDLDSSQSSTTSDSGGEETQVFNVDDSIQVKDLDIQIQKGEFICVIGEVGSGKSSLINALLGDMIYMSDDTIGEYQGKKMDDAVRHELIEKSKEHKGIVKIGGSVSYVQQSPWIQNKTIRDNILFGLPLDENKYNRIIELCELASDLEILPGGDLTEIGEKGINLSGGQKARISLARAIYADADIILMDDPISALDSNVKKSIFNKLFLGELKNKTRILVTHAVEFLSKVDRIIIMEKGRVKYIATYDDLQHSEEIKHIVESLKKVSVNKDEDEEESEVTSLEEQKEQIKGKKVDVRKSFLSDKGTNITKDENEEKIEVSWRVYGRFFFSDNTWIFYVFAIPMTFGSAYSALQTSIYTGKWLDHENSKDKFWSYFTIILILSVLFSVLSTLISTLISLATIRISKKLHVDMLERTSNAPINLYFDKTPTGRILNRFSSDINRLDNDIDK
jgi:ATP-binding cassette, subfamily C (CFTR/MRP), member 1